MATPVWIPAALWRHLVAGVCSGVNRAGASRGGVLGIPLQLGLRVPTPSRLRKEPGQVIPAGQPRAPFLSYLVHDTQE